GYAVSVALNGILPANIGTLVFLIMLTVLIGMSFASVLGAYAVEKIFFTVAGAFVYLYLFLSVGGSFDISFDWVHKRPVATVVLFGGGIMLLVLLVRRFWPYVVAWWDKAKEGGAILGRPRTFLGRVFLPSFIGWCAMLTTIGVFLNAYGIPVSFDTLMHVAGGNSLANVTSFTPGGVGVTQAWNVASLKGVASSTDATAYSVAQQLVLGWLLGAVALLVATKLVPGASDSTFRAALAVAALVALFNAVLPPLVAALRLPFTALLGFFGVLFVDAGMLLLAGRISSGLSIDSFWSALGVALAAAAVGVVLSVLFGTNDDDVYSLRVVQRIARRSGERVVTDTPGIVFLELDGLALPVLQRAMRDGHAPTTARR